MENSKDIFKEASRSKLRFTTKKGSLSAENLWDLNLTDLDELAVSLESEYNASAKTSFLVKRTSKDKALKLQFDIVLSILTTKAEEAEAATKAIENKAHNDKIFALIEKKREGALAEKDEKELLKMLRK
jgi:hypothetical protein